MMLLPLVFLIGCSAGGVDPGVKSVQSDPPAPVQTQDPMDTAERVAASHILVSYQGADQAGSQIKRTREEALLRAKEARDRLLAGGDFAELAKLYSDDPTGPRGGFLGGFTRGAMVPAFEQAAFKLPVGSLSEIVETPFGFHIIRREPLQEIHVAQILVQWKGIQGAKAVRSKDEALLRAQEACERAKQGVSFDVLAREYSDGPMATRGGDLGWFTQGQFRPDFEEAAFKLEPGQLSEVVETPVGYHLIRRVE